MPSKEQNLKAYTHIHTQNNNNNNNKIRLLKSQQNSKKTKKKDPRRDNKPEFKTCNNNLCGLQVIFATFVCTRRKEKSNKM